MNGLTFDKVRAREVLEELVKADSRRTHLFSKVHRLNGSAPQFRLSPHGLEKGLEEHRRYLFFAVLTDRRQTSEQVYGNHVGLWNKHPFLYGRELLKLETYKAEKEVSSLDLDLLDEEVVLTQAKTGEQNLVSLVKALLDRHGFGIAEQSAKSWVVCSKTLWEHFGGDPLRLYEEGSIEAILRWVDEEKKKAKRDPLSGFGPKLLSLLAMFYEELRVLPHVKGAFPVDIHIQRLCIATGIVRGSGVVDAAGLAEFLRPRLCDVCYENGWSPLDLAQDGWFLGNRRCQRCSKVKDIRHSCPLVDICEGAISSQTYGKLGKWNFSSPILSKGLPNLLLFE